MEHVTPTPPRQSARLAEQQRFTPMKPQEEKPTPQAFGRKAGAARRRTFQQVQGPGECSGAIKVGDVVSAAEAGERDLVLGEVCEFYEEGQGLRMLLRRFLGASELRQRCLNREALQDQELVDSKEVVELPVLAILEKVQVVSEEDYLSYVEDETLDLAALGSDSGPFFCRRQIESSGTLWPAAWDHESRKKRREESLRDWRPRSTTGREVGAAASSASRSELLPRAAAALKAGAAAGMLPGRETEQERVMQFLRSAVQEGGRKEVLYVSGVPGTGKTASVLEAVRRLQISRSESLQSIYVNAMSLATPTAVFGEICRQVRSQRRESTEAEARESVRKAFTQEKRKQVVILLIDEVDALLTKAQSVLYQIFDWVSHPSSRLAVVAIANTMDLPERLLPRVASRIGVQRVSFNAYSRDQLKAILVNRLRAGNALEAFQDKALTICAARVAADGGDARKALQVCRRALEASLASQRDAGPVTFDEMTAAQADLLQLNPAAMAIQGLPLKAQRLLLALVLELRKQSAHVIPLHKVLRRFQTVLRVKEQLEAPGEDACANADWMMRCWDEGKTDLIPRLQAVGILSLNKGSGVEDAGASIPVLELGQSLDVEDVVNALVEDDLAKELLDVVPPSGPLTLN